MKLTYIALGSNLGLPRQQLESAVTALTNLPHSQGLKLSRWYRSAAIGGPADQPDYLNAVCALHTDLSPNQLLAELQSIEQRAGRVRDIRWGPRTLDLDIIWIEGFQSDRPELTVPHPRAHERAFVLRPLQDLAASFELQGQPLHYWLTTVADQVLTPL